jgi:hypothetical protein
VLRTSASLVGIAAHPPVNSDTKIQEFLSELRQMRETGRAPKVARFGQRHGRSDQFPLGHVEGLVRPPNGKSSSGARGKRCSVPHCRHYPTGGRMPECCPHHAPTHLSCPASRSGSAAARHTEETTGPATPATAFQGVYLFLFWGRGCGSPFLALLCLCVLAVPVSALFGEGFHRPCNEP